MQKLNTNVTSVHFYGENNEVKPIIQADRKSVIPTYENHVISNFPFSRYVLGWIGLRCGIKADCLTRDLYVAYVRIIRPMCGVPGSALSKG